MNNICHLCGTDHPAELSVVLDGFNFCSSTCADEHKGNLQSEKRFVRGQQVMFRHNSKWIISTIYHAYFANMDKSWRYEMPNPGSEATWDIPEKHLRDAELLYDQPQQTARQIYEWQYRNRRYFRDEQDKAKLAIREAAHLSRLASACPFYGKPRLPHHRYLSGLRKLQAAEWRVFHSVRLEQPLTAQQTQALRDIAASQPSPCLKYDRDAEWLGVLFERNLIQSEYELIDGGLKYIGLIVLPDGWKHLATIFTGELSTEDADIMFEAVNQAKLIEDYEISDGWSTYFLTDDRRICVDANGTTFVKEQ